MRRREELTLKDYKKEMEDIENDIVAAKAEAEFTLVDKNQLQVLLDLAELFLTNLEPLFISFGTANRQLFAHFVFPAGVLYKDGEIPPKALMFESLEAIESKNKKMKMVKGRGIGSNFFREVVKEFTRLSRLNMGGKTTAPV
jgi:hypothetical protein